MTHTGIYDWTRVPIGITFQIVMTQVLRCLHWKQALLQVDILIYSKNFEVHLQHMKQVFSETKGRQITLYLETDQMPICRASIIL